MAFDVKNFLAAALLSGVAAQAAAAPAPPLLTYSGHLMGADGSAETAQGTLHFRVYSGPSGGAPLWTEDVVVLPAADGWFAAVLGLTSPLTGLDWESDLWLGIGFAGEVEMAPRVRLTSSARSLSVGWARLGGIPAPCGTGQFLRGYDAGGAPVCAEAVGVSALSCQQVSGPTLTLGTLQSSGQTVPCPAGSHVTGGGFSVSSASVAATSSQASGEGWAVAFSNGGLTSASAQGYAVCCSVQ